MKGLFKVAFALIISSVVFVSCNKQNEEQLKGTWNLLSKPVENVVYKWKFTDSRVFVMATDANENEGLTGDLDTCSFGAYVLKNGVLTLALEVRACRGSTYAGDWDVQTLNAEFLTIRNETSNGTIWYEFEKE